jgi:glycerol-1-phosphate dehydrogenase [NAD(P)+]
LMGSLDEILLHYAEDIRNRTKDGMAVLAKLITLSGLTMSLSHATTPSSGYEHVISHILDLINEQREAPLAQHGTQVVLATLLAAQSYQVFLRSFDPGKVDLQSCFPGKEQMRAEILHNFKQVDTSGKAGEECWHDYELKLEAWHAQRQNLPRFLKDWPQVKAELKPLTRTPKRIAKILRAVNSPMWFDQLIPPFDEAQVKFAYLNAPLMRKRLTVGDLLVFFGWDRQRIWKRIWQRCWEVSKVPKN